MSASDVECANARLQLDPQRGGLGLEGVPPGAGRHGGVAADDGELPQQNSVVNRSHPRLVSVRCGIVVVQALS